MLRCGSCGLEYDDGKRFCRRCGTRLEPVVSVPWCEACGLEHASGKRYCRRCGAPLTTRVEPAGEPGAAGAHAAPGPEPADVGTRHAAVPAWLIACGAVLVVALVAGTAAIIFSRAQPSPAPPPPIPTRVEEPPASAAPPASAVSSSSATTPPSAQPPSLPAPSPTPERPRRQAASPSAVSGTGLPTDERYLASLSFDRYQAHERLAEGLKYYLARGAARDLARALEAFGAAAPTEGRACYYLAEMYSRGDGVPRDARVARTWLEKGAALGDTQCRLALRSGLTSR
jgi:hypothetical protein